MSIPIPQIALVAGALVIGVLLDRMFLTNGSATSHQITPVVAASQDVAPAAAPSNSTPLPVAVERAGSDKARVARPSLNGILAEHDAGQRTRDLQAFVGALKPGEFADALKRIRQITGNNERELASRMLVAQWVQSDADGALQFAATNRGYEYIANDVFQQRAAADLDSALSSAQQIPGGDLRYQALLGILSFKADSDPIGALQLAQTLGNFPGNEPLSNILYRQWAANDPQAAALYASQQGQGGGWRSPVSQVVNTWAQHDPVAAANWSMSLPDAESQARSLGQVMRDWGREDSTAAANWIQSLPVGTQRDSALAGFAQSMVAADPQNALNWVSTMTDAAAKQRALQRMSHEIMFRDPQNGPAMLQAAGLPADQIQQAQQRRGRGP